MTERISSLSQRVEKIINGQFALVDLPWPIISKATQALFPGSITLFVGAGGTSKSLMVLQCLLQWHLNGVKACGR